jgi:uncharacterized membrane protein YozB (DUF420 family)
MLKLTSLFVLILIGFGLYYRKERPKHIIFMSSAFLIDIAIVAYIEFTREAINTTLHPPHAFIIFHVIISVLVIVLYLHQIISGIKILKNKISKTWHRNVGISFVVLRLLNFVTSLFVENFTRH